MYVSTCHRGIITGSGFARREIRIERRGLGRMRDVSCRCRDPSGRRGDSGVPHPGVLDGGQCVNVRLPCPDVIALESYRTFFLTFLATCSP